MGLKFTEVSVRSKDLGLAAISPAGMFPLQLSTQAGSSLLSYGIPVTALISLALQQIHICLHPAISESIHTFRFHEQRHSGKMNAETHHECLWEPSFLFAFINLRWRTQPWAQYSITHLSNYHWSAQLPQRITVCGLNTMHEPKTSKYCLFRWE